MPRTVRLPPGIYKTDSGKYRVRFYVGKDANGKDKYSNKTFTRLDDAKRWQGDMQRAKETGRVDQADADMQTFSALAAEHMQAKRPDIEARTYNNYRRFWSAHVRPHPMAAMPLRSITVETGENFRDDLRAGVWKWDPKHDRPRKVPQKERVPVGEQSIRQTLVLCQGIMERAVRLGRIPYNPFKAVQKPKATSKAKRTGTARAVSPTTVEAIRAQMRLADATLVSVLAYTGMRPEEARALCWGDIGKQTIRVERAADVDGEVKPTKTEQQRSVRLLKPLTDDLTVWRKASGSPPDSALIFPRADGSAWTDTDYRNWRKRRFYKALDEAKLDRIVPYDLRHSAVSLWLYEGVQVHQIAKWMGHKPSETQDTYGHIIDDLDPDDRKPAEEVIEDVRRDMVLTWSSVHKRPQQSKRPHKKPRKQAENAAPA